ncbi:MAG: glycerophosphodiester phosphodiesterase, partial [Candidatus Wallbacteria bacterium]|nr:glycerophosphodiester phosphodiesterase [Candidatus Wallbacteria bacterium]
MKPPIALALSLSISAAASFAGGWISDPVEHATQQRVAPWVIAHRGYSAVYPENTMRSFREAIAAGADAIEMDVQTTADGRLVVLHDDVLDRTSDGKGPVGALTLEQVKRLDAGRWKGARFAGERIPTLDEVLELSRGTGVGLVVEAKTPYALDPRLAGRIVELLDRAGVTSRTILQSFDHRPLAEI